MQLAVAAFTSLFSGGAATAGAATGIGSTAAMILKGVAGVASVLSGLGAANAEAQSFEMKAADADAQSEDEKAQGMQRTTSLKRELMKALGENDVQFAAAGIDLSAGVAQDNRDALEKRSAQEVTVDRADTDARRAMLKARASGYRGLAGSARRNGGLGAIAGLANVGISLAG